MNDKKEIPKPPSRIPPPPPKKEETVVIQKEKVYINNGEYKPLPSAYDLEQVVLGALLIDKRCIPEVIDILVPDIFYDPRHQLIFKAIADLHRQNKPIDILTVSNELRRTNKLASAGGDFHIVEMTQMVNSGAHIDYHAHILLQKYIQRELILTSRKTEKDAFKSDTDVFNLMDNIEANLMRINSVAVKKSQKEDLSEKDELRQRVKDKRAGKSIGVPIGVQKYDDWCGGFYDRELVTIAARPSMGKTSLMLAVAVHAVFNLGYKVAIYSLEMSKKDLKYRIVASLTGIKFERIRKGDLTDEELEHVDAALDKINASGLEIIDTPEHKNVMERIEASMRKLAQEGYRMFMLDYVQLIKLARPSKDRTSDLSDITRNFKALGNELNLPLIFFAQLNRSVDSRPGNMPVLADLKQSGSIEEDSDTVIFLVRRAYYQEKENPSIELPAHVKGELDFIQAKGRNTGTKAFKMYLDFMHYKLKDNYEEVDF